MKKRILISLLFFATQSVFAAATFTPKSGEVKFLAVGKPGFLKIRGESKGRIPEGTLIHANDQITGTLSFELKHLDTGIELRNDHMLNNYLEVSKYPKATLEILALTVTSQELEKDFTKKFSGKLTLHGETKDVDGEFTFKATDQSILAKSQIKVSDFKIDVPKYMGVTVSETVDLEIAITFDKKNQNLKLAEQTQEKDKKMAKKAK